MNDIKDELIQTIDAMEDLELYEEMLEYKVKAQSKMLKGKVKALSHQLPGILLGGIGGLMTSKMIPKNNSGDSENEAEDDSSIVNTIDKIDHYLALFQKWSPVLRALLSEQSDYTEKKNNKTVEEICEGKHEAQVADA